MIWFGWRRGSPKESDMKEVYDFLKGAGTYYLATMDGDQPRVRPFGTIDMFDGRLYIQTGLKKDVAKQLAKNPNAELCAFAGGRWIRVCGRLILDDRREARKHMLDEYPSLRAMYNEDDGNTAVYYLKDAKATISSFTEPPKVIEF